MFGHVQIAFFTLRDVKAMDELTWVSTMIKLPSFQLLCIDHLVTNTHMAKQILRSQLWILH